jgi:hypothetical protein
MQNNLSKLTLSNLANEFLKVFYILLAIFLSISFKYLSNIFLWDKCKIDHCDWPNLQITHCGIKNNL